MRILITADPYIPVLPFCYGGIERIIFILVSGLTEKGHDVTLLAQPKSNVPCKLEAYPGIKSTSRIDLLKNIVHVSSKTLFGKFEIVHSFGRLAYISPVLVFNIPKIMSYQRPVTYSRAILSQKLSHTAHYILSDAVNI